MSLVKAACFHKQFQAIREFSMHSVTGYTMTKRVLSIAQTCNKNIAQKLSGKQTNI